jgi:hypothetical protein
VTSLWIASAVVALVQYLRLRLRRLIPLMILYLLLAIGESLEGWDWRRPWVHVLAAVAGFVLLVAVSPRHQHPAP